MKSLAHCEASFFGQVENFHSGGGCMIDIIQLDNGYVLSITDEAICIHADRESVYNDVDTAIQCFMFPLNHKYEVARSALCTLHYELDPQLVMQALLTISGEFLNANELDKSAWVSSVCTAVTYLAQAIYPIKQIINDLIDALDLIYRKNWSA